MNQPSESAVAAAPSGGYAPARVMWTLTFAGACVNGAYAGSRTALPLFGIELGASPFAIGVLVSLMGLVPALAALQLGRYLDKLGPRLPMIIASLGVLAGTLIPFVLPSLPALYVTSILVGTFSSFLFMAQNQSVGKLCAPEDRPAQLAHLALGYSVGSFLGPLLAGSSIDQFGHARAFLVLSVLPIVSLGVLFLPAAKTMTSVARPAARREKRDSAIDFFRLPAMRHVYIIGLLSTVCWDSLTMVMPIYGHSAGLSATAIGTVMSAFAVGTFTVRLAAPVLSRRIKIAQLLMVAFIMTAIGYALIPTTGAALLLALLTFTMGLGLGFSQPVTAGLLINAAPPHRMGEALGLRTAISNVSQTVAPLAMGAAGSLFGTAPIFLALAVVAAVGAKLARRQ